MDKLWGLDLDTVLAMAAILLGLSIAAQVLQEIYKFVTASKCRMYRLALRDFLGPWVDELYRRPEAKPGEAAPAEGLFLRGPFQFGWGEKKKARLLPLEKQNLLLALEVTAPEWTRKVIEALKKEVKLQQGDPAAPSPILRGLVDEAWKGYQGEEDGPWKAFDFLQSWGAVTQPPPAETKGEAEAAEPPLKPVLAESIDAARLLSGYYQEFLPDRAKVETRFEQFNENFEHSYDRRNLRQTLLLALVLTVGLNLPFTELYLQAKSLTPEEATALADSLAELYDKRAEATDESAGEDGDDALDPAAELQTEESGATPADDEDAQQEEPAENGAAEDPGDGAEGGGDGDGGDDTAALAAPPADGGSTDEDENLEELILELREPLETLFELDRKREEKELTKLMAKLQEPLVEFSKGGAVAQKTGQQALLAKLSTPLEEFVGRRSAAAAREPDFDGLVAEVRESLEGFVAQGESGEEQDLAALQGELRKLFAQFLDERSGRGKFFSRGAGHLARLWQEDRSAIPPFLANCLVTALLISFGAPFWHRLSQALLGIRRPTRANAPEPETG